MGQKVNPIGLRLAVRKNWCSRWFAKKSNFGDLLHEDCVLRNFIKKEYYSASIARILIERFGSRVRITIFAARTGVFSNKVKEEAVAEGAAPAKPLKKRGNINLSEMQEKVSKLLKPGQELALDIVEVRQPETCAQLVAENIATQLEHRIAFRRAMKKAIQNAMDNEAEGIKIKCSGRLGAAELARTESYKEGRTPLHTLKAHIDYGFAEANTTAGKIGVKVWICHKEPTEEMKNAVNAQKSKAQKATAR